MMMRIFLSATMTFMSSNTSCTLQLLERVLVVLCTRCSNDVECAVEILFKPQ